MIKKFISVFFCALMILNTVAFSSAEASAASSTSSAGKVSTQSGNLNIRKSASTSSSVLASLKNNSYVTLISKSGDFWKVEYKSAEYGYCHSDYIQTVSGSVAKYVTVSSGSLNVRAGAGTSYEIKDKLSNGKCVVVLSESSSWSKILYNGTQTGYVSSKYLSESKTSYKPISLSVVSFKQTDSRWKNIQIGNQGDTIGSSGCTTTCLAMTESFRTQITVTPAAMVSKLTYSDSGMLYWPSNYKTQLISSDDYLSLAYTCLSEGKPVIIGAKKSNGAQHWVVVTAFSGSSLKAENFKINDPGSESRTTLADFIAVYPNLYKAAWY